MNTLFGGIVSLLVSIHSSSILFCFALVVPSDGFIQPLTKQIGWIRDVVIA